VNQAVIRDFLTGAGYHVDLASSGQEAINAAETRRYACVLMDLQMPGMDGIEAMLQMIQQDDRRDQPSPPFVALTAHATDDHRRRCLNHGMKAFLVKPIDRQALIDTVDSLVADAFAGANDSELRPPAVFATEIYDPQEATSADLATDNNTSTGLSEVWRERLLKAAGNDHETAQSLILAFMEEVPQLCKNFSEGLGRQDARAVRLAAHTLKSCLKYVAEPSDWQFVERCELLAMEGNLTDIEPLAPQVRSIAMRWVERLAQIPQSDTSDDESN
jgi:CheY-like chemotaxis protein